MRKTNTERLRIMAAKTYDVGDDELETMDRTALLDVIATDIVARRGAASRRRSEIRSGTGDGNAARIEKDGVRTETNGDTERD